MRAFIQVPQSLVSGVRPGLEAKLRLAEQRGRLWAGSVMHSAAALDPVSRSMTVEVRVPNPEHVLLPGMYVEVTLQLQGSTQSLKLPGSAISAGKNGVRVATVDAQGHVRWRAVRVERDNGVDVEISEGLTPSDTVIANPGPDIEDGITVRAAN